MAPGPPGWVLLPKRVDSKEEMRESGDGLPNMEEENSAVKEDLGDIHPITIQVVGAIPMGLLRSWSKKEEVSEETGHSIQQSLFP